MALKAWQGAPSLHALDGLDLVAINPVILVRGPNIALVQVDLRARLLQRLGVVVADGHAVEDRARLVLVLPQQPRTPIAPDMVDVLHAAGARAIHLLECARVYEWEHHVDKADVSVGTLWLLGVDLASGVPRVTVLVLDLIELIFVGMVCKLHGWSGNEGLCRKGLLKELCQVCLPEVDPLIQKPDPPVLLLIDDLGQELLGKDQLRRKSGRLVPLDLPVLQARVLDVLLVPLLVTALPDVLISIIMCQEDIGWPVVGRPQVVDVLRHKIHRQVLAAHGPEEEHTVGDVLADIQLWRHRPQHACRDLGNVPLQVCQADLVCSIPILTEDGAGQPCAGGLALEDHDLGLVAGPEYHGVDLLTALGIILAGLLL
mmetsp:Transcript_34991/g.94843  ORF Transcript_34991/g.94843 Transcript_34991/m.94843 type:complete len:372 (-) Transcript_34991:207-1322(-)